MKHSKTTVILTILCSIAFFVLGLLWFDKILDIIIPKVDRGFYQVTELGGEFKARILFSIALGITPFLIFLTWRLSPIIARNKKLASILVVILCMILSIIVRQQILKSYFGELTRNLNALGERINVSYPLDKVYFEYYIICGLIVGCFLSYLLLRQKRM